MLNRVRTFFGTYALSVFVTLLFLFIYLPICILVVFSFNKVAFPYRWVGFSLHWYQELFTSAHMWHVFKNSLIVATSSVFLSLTLGVLLVFYSAQSKLRMVLPIFYANLIFPEIVLAVGLLSLFTFFYIPLGIPSLIAGHTLLGLGYVVPIVSARFAELDESIVEASLDLGATVNQTFVKVILPMLVPALVASGLLVFIISFDDFLIAFFCAGTESQTLPLYMFALIRSGVSPVLNALSTLLIAITTILVLIYSSLKSKIRMF